MDLDFVDRAIVGKDQQIGMRRSDEQMLDEVATLGGSAEPALATSSLPLIGRDGCSLDVAAVGHGDGDILVGNQILDGKLDPFIDNLRSPALPKIFLHFSDSVDHYPS